MSREKGIVKLLRFINGAWRVADYGVPSKIAIYTAMGYVVES
jgi:hypothetical protein